MYQPQLPHTVCGNFELLQRGHTLADGARAIERALPQLRAGKSFKFAIVTGGKDRGKTGKVLRVDPRKSRVYVEGLNIVKRHYRGR